MPRAIRGLKYIGSDERGVSCLSGEICSTLLIVFLLFGGCLLFVVPLWMILTHNITPRLWVPPWDQYTCALFIAAGGAIGVLLSFRQLMIRKQMKSMRTADELSRMIGISQDELAEKLEGADFRPELNVNGTYYWDMSKLPRPDLLLRAVEIPSPAGKLLKPAETNDNGANASLLLRLPRDR